VEHSTDMQLVQVGSTIFICYVTCANEVKLANESWNTVQCSFVMQLV